MGRTLEEAFLTHWALQRACEIQVATMSMGQPIRIAPEVVAVHQRDVSQVQLPTGPGVPDFQAMVRIIDRKFMERETKRVLDSLDIAINPKLKVRRLSGGQRQAVAIGRALAFDARLIIMDEPTANLSVAKVDKLIEVTQRLKDLGIAVIIITHRLDEAFAVADRFAVMRHGEVVGRYGVGEVTETDVAHLISTGTLGDSGATSNQKRLIGSTTSAAAVHSWQSRRQQGATHHCSCGWHPFSTPASALRKAARSGSMTSW